MHVNKIFQERKNYFRIYLGTANKIILNKKTRSRDCKESMDDEIFYTWRWLELHLFNNLLTTGQFYQKWYDWFQGLIVEILLKLFYRVYLPKNLNFPQFFRIYFYSQILFFQNTACSIFDLSFPSNISKKHAKEAPSHHVKLNLGGIQPRWICIQHFWPKLKFLMVTYSSN